LYETSLNDIQIKHDFFVAVPDLRSKGVRVTVKERSMASMRYSENLKGLKQSATPDLAHTALVQAADDNSEMYGDALDGGQVESTRRAVKAVEAATKALNDAAAKAMIHEDMSSR
jgi:hypothetical protein